MEQVVLITLSVVGLLAVASSFVFAFLRRRDNRFRSVRLAIFAAVVTFVFTTACVVAVTRIFYFDSLSRAPSTGIQVVFTSQTYDTRTGLFGLDGSVSGLKPEQQLWIFFRDARRDHHFLALAPCDILPENRFSCQKIATGAPRPAQPDIKGFIVAAMPEAVAVLRQSNSGSPGTVDLYQLPRGATRISQISVGS